MKRIASIASIGLALAAAASEPAAAHHVMGGEMPKTAMQGLLSGLGHPVIGLDHFAAVVAAGCLAAAHRSAVMLVIGYVLAMAAGAALHVQGVNVPAAEILVALSVLVLGAVTVQWRETLSLSGALALFVVAGAINGYALGESIAGAEPTPLYAYFIGLAAIQSAVGLAVMAIARVLAAGEKSAVRVRLIGACIAGIGIALLAKGVMPGA
jgi:urease accessory protein